MHKKKGLYLSGYKKWVNIEEIVSFDQMGLEPTKNFRYSIVFSNGVSYTVTVDEYKIIRDFLEIPEPICNMVKEDGSKCDEYIGINENYKYCSKCGEKISPGINKKLEKDQKTIIEGKINNEFRIISQGK